jgi:competence protein ComEA
MLLKCIQSILQIVMAGFLGLFILTGHAHAKVEVNSADQTALESVRGLGPSKAKAILQERQKNGPFKSPTDLHSRVKGIGEKTVERLMQNGLTINSKGMATKTSEPSSKRSVAKEKEGQQKGAVEKSPRQSRKTKEEKKSKEAS